MCGIVGYIGKNNCVDKILNGLKRLEYRGYDSAGIAFLKNHSTKIIKKCGKLNELINHIKAMKKKPEGFCGIGHTRWATHGKPNDVNSHPHKKNRVTIVHNGIIENYKELKQMLKEKNYSFKTQTDSEIIAALIDSFYEKDPINAIISACKMLKGSFALGIIFEDKKDELFGVKKDSPLIVGTAKEENFLASDVQAIIQSTKKYFVLNENEIAVLKKDSLNVLDFEKKTIKKNFLTVNWDIKTAEKNGFSHYMLKEIFEQPEALKRCFENRLLKEDVEFKLQNLSDEKIKNFKKIHIIGCGTAFHAGLIGKSLIEKFLRIPVEIEYASEFRYKNPILNENELAIFISQSGETADTLAALNLAKEKNIFTLAIVNVVESSIARTADEVFYTHAGPEISVASTKAFTVQIASLLLLTLKFAKVLDKISKKDLKSYCASLNNIPNFLENVLNLNEEILKLAKIFYKKNNIFFIGRGMDFSLSLEASLKLKELSYIHSEAFCAGELKHGPISLIKKNTPVIATITQTNIFSKTINNVKEVAARGAKVLILCTENVKIDKDIAELVIKIPKTLDFLTPLYAIVPMQLFSYNVCVLKGLDVDKPRNLAKSVTVE